MAEVKTYIADHANLSIGLIVGGRNLPIGFIGGKFATDDSAKQAAIEDTDLFRSGHIKLVVPPSPRDALVVAASASASLAASAEKAAASAEAERAEIDALPKRLRAAAEAAKKSAAADVAALANFDKPKAAAAA